MNLSLLTLILIELINNGFGNYIYVEKFNSSYKLYEIGKDWIAANSICYNDGSQLLIPESKDELEFALKMMNNVGHIWTGLFNKFGSNSTFVNMNGTSIENMYINWDEDEPFILLKEMRFVMLQKNGLYQVKPCHHYSYFICKKTKVDSVIRSYDQLISKDYIYEGKFSAFFKFIKISQDWLTAVYDCIEDGGQIFIPKSVEESIFALNLIPKDVEQIWIGSYKAYKNGKSMTWNGTTIKNFNIKWGSDEPNNSMIYPICAGFNRNTISNFAECDEKKPFICKIQIEYECNSKTKSCYNFHYDLKTWREAEYLCSSEKAKLIIINNIEESKVIADIINKMAPETNSYIHSGFCDIFPGRFFTSEGLDLKETGYEKWAENKPEGIDKKLRCGGITRNGELINTKCEDKSMYICERCLL